MTALTKDVDVFASVLTSMRRLPLQASANPYSGSLMSLAATGYVHELVAGEPFVGVNKRKVPTADVGAADGDLMTELFAGFFTIMVTISSIGQDDVALGRKVYASDDATFTFTGESNSFIGTVIAISGIKVVVLCRTHDTIQSSPMSQGSILLADAAATLDSSHLDKLVKMPNTAARTLTLPPAGDCCGRFITLLKTTAAAFAVTLDGAGAETINGAATHATCDAQYDTVTIRSNGTGWDITNFNIA